MYAHGINDAALVPGTDRFLQVVSCNTHNLAVLLKTVALQDRGAGQPRSRGASCACGVPPISVKPRTLFRRPTPASMGTCRFGTHHAKDAWHLFQTLGLDLNLFFRRDQAQYAIHAQYLVQSPRAAAGDAGRGAGETAAEQTCGTCTHKTTASTIFSFGRDHGYFGRLLNQTVVSVPTLGVRAGQEISGFTLRRRTAIPC